MSVNIDTYDIDPEEDAIAAVNDRLARAVGELTDAHEVVYEDREHIVYADHSRTERRQLFDDLDLDDLQRELVADSIAERADALVPDHDWSGCEPLVVDKPVWFCEVEQHVLGRVADLIRESDGAARGVDRWATGAMGLTLREWGAEYNTDRDHGNIGKNVRRGREADDT